MKELTKIILINLITIIRILGVFFLVPIYKTYGGTTTAILAIFCYLTDTFDGILARKFHASTFLGSILDGVADKLFSLANLILLFKITPYTIFPFLCEIIIVIIQSIRFGRNVNVKSSLIGKIKTWIMGITIVAIYFAVDINNISFLSKNFINLILSIEESKLFLGMFLPLYIFEILTIISYLTLKDIYKSKKERNNINVNINIEKGKNFHEKCSNFRKIMLDNSFYEKYKDSAAFKTMFKELINNK